jgi:hypothetical protein
MLFRYLLRKEEEGVIQFLIDKLYEEPIEHIDYYLP